MHAFALLAALWAVFIPGVASPSTTPINLDQATELRPGLDPFGLRAGLDPAGVQNETDGAAGMDPIG